MGFQNAPPIRPLKEEDAEKFLALLKQLDEETTFMLYEPGERKTSAAEQAKKTRDIFALGGTILVVEDAARLVGFVGAFAVGARRKRHCRQVVIGILQSHAGRGIGRALLNALDQWAQENSVHRLELTVVSRNARAMALYQKCGFQTEGERRASLLIDDKLVDEFAMAKLL